MGLQTYDGRDVRIQQASRSHADVVQLSGTAARKGRPREDCFQDEPHTVYQVSLIYRTSHLTSLCITPKINT